MAKHRRRVDPQEETTTIAPIQYIPVGDEAEIPVPLARITTCGGLQIEILQEVVSTDPSQGCYRRFLPEQGPGGTTTALSLLSLFSSHPEGYLAKDWLTEHLGTPYQKEEDEDWGSGLARVDNVVSNLRTLLCPAPFAHTKSIRHQVIRYLTNHRQSGPGYQLASLPLLWLDVRVVTTLAKQAVAAEQQGQDAVPLWEEVVTLTSKGVYLPQEMYSDWATDMRLHVQSLGKQGVLALHRLLLARGGAANEERVLLALRDYWQHHPTDEDVLCPLLELLGKRGCLQEADACYERLCTILRNDGREPLPHTHHVVEQVRQSPFPSTSPNTIVGSNVIGSLSPGLEGQEYSPSFSPAITQSIIDAVGELEKEHHTPMNRLRRETTQGILGLLSGSALPLEQDSIQTYSNFPQTVEIDLSLHEVLPLLTTGVNETWKLYYNGGRVDDLHRTIVSYIFWLENTPSLVQEETFDVLSQCYQLSAMIALEKEDYPTASAHISNAIANAQKTGNINLLSAALMRKLTVLYYQKRYRHMHTVVQHAAQYLGQVTPLMQAHIYSELAVDASEIGASRKDVRAYIDLAAHVCPQEAEKDLAFTYTHASEYIIRLNQEIAYTNLGLSKDAWEALTLAERFVSNTPSTRRIELLTHQITTAIELNDLDTSIIKMEEAVHASKALKTDLWVSYIECIYQRLQKKWKYEDGIRRIALMLDDR